MTTIPDPLLTARLAAKAEYAAAHNALALATARDDEARKAVQAADTALNDWFNLAIGRKVSDG